MSNDPILGYTLADTYKIKDLVGRESLGTVYRATDVESGSAVHVKVLDPGQIDNQEIMGRFGREMLATAAVEHANTVRMLDFGSHHKLFQYIVLEAITAHTLTEELAAEKFLPFDRVAHIAAQIASALEAAHGEGIVHRNLGPDNVLLLDNVRGDYVKLRDFGLSRLVDAAAEVGDPDITDFGTRVGAVEYMAPEYIQSATTAPGVDVYGLGMLMFHMLSGEAPFTGPPAKVMKAHVQEQPEAVTGVPAWMADLMTKMVSKDPSKRPPAGAVLKILRSGMGADLLPPEIDASYVPPPKRLPKEVEPVAEEADEEVEADTTLYVVAGLVAFVAIVAIVVLLGLIFAG